MPDLTWTRGSTRRRWGGFLVAAAVGLTAGGCTASDGDGDGTGVTMRPPPEVCMAFEASMDCGVFYLEQDCDDDPEEGTNTDTDGGTPGGDGPSDTCDQTAEVEACVLGAIAEGNSFAFTADLTVSRDDAPPNGISGSARYVVATDGSGWEDSREGDGICTWDLLRSRQAIALGECGDLGCVVDRLNSAEDAEVCEDAPQVCDE